MATYTNETKNSATFSNQDKTGQDLTWDEANFTWDDANGTWDTQYSSYVRQTKNSATFTNVNKS